MQRLHLLALGLVATGLAAVNLQAAEASTSSEVPASDLKELNDPTILSRRVWFETEWNKFEDGNNVFEETLGTMWAWRVSENQDFGVRLKLPFKFRFGSDTPGVSDIEGLGDIKFAAGTAWRLSKTFRIGLGVDLQAPTGREELSDNAWRIQEFGAIGWDITSWLTFSPSFEYNQSLTEEGSAPPIHFLETFFPFTFILPHKWAISVGYENKVDFENDNYVTNRAKIQVAKELENIPLSFALSAKRDFDSGEKEFQMNFVISYYFRSKPAPLPSASYKK
jgi:Putative MetA-pathway of phenol degradation